MFQKDMNIGVLLDFYGDLLTPHRRQALNDYYNEDMSLSEIAEEMGISRQGVRNLIKCAEEELRRYEEKLALADRFSRAKSAMAKVSEKAEQEGVSEELKQALIALSDILTE